MAGQLTDAACPVGDPMTQANALGGDLNADGIIDNYDVLLILQCSSGDDACLRPED